MLLWAYVVLIAGSVTGLVNFRLKLVSTGLAALLIGGWLVLRGLRRRRVQLANIEIGVAVFLTVQLLAAVFSEDPRRSFEVVAQYVVYILLFYTILDWVRAGLPPELIEKTLLIVGGIAVGFSLLDLGRIFLQWRDLSAGLEFASPFQHRLFSVFGDANLLAAFVNLIAPLAAARLLVSKQRLPKIFLVVLLLAALPVAVFASSRGGLLGSLAAVTVFGGLWVAVVSPKARARTQWLFAAARKSPYITAVLIGLLLLVLTNVAVSAFRFEGSPTHSRLLDARRGFWAPAWIGIQAEPLLGIGPGLYPALYMRYQSMPPVRPYLHAHSLPVNVTAESGFLGGAALLFLAASIGLAVWKALPDAWEDRAHYAGICAALVGLAAHLLVDDNTRFLATAITAIVLLAIVLGGADVAKPRRALHPIWLGMLGIPVLVFSIVSLGAQSFHERGLDAAIEGDWKQAGEFFDQAKDIDAGLAVYWLHSGYAYGMQATDGDDLALRVAIANYEQGIALEPEYAPNYANLGGLYRGANNADAARSAFDAGRERAARAAIYPLNAGAVAEWNGDLAAAREDFATGLRREPQLHSSIFWTVSDFRAEVVESYKADLPEPELLDQARQAISNGNLALAEELLADLWQGNPSNPKLYAALGLLARAQGDDVAARDYFQSSLWVQSQFNALKLETILELAALELDEGDTEAALAQYNFAIDLVTKYTIYGWGTYGWTPYEWFVFGRRGLPVDVLPFVERTEMTVQFAQRLEEVAAQFDAAGIPEPQQALAQPIFRTEERTK